MADIAQREHGRQLKDKMLCAGYNAWLSGAGGEKLKTWKQFGEYFGLLEKQSCDMSNKELLDMAKRLSKYV